MFWKLSFRQPSAIDTLLDKDDVTLHEILDEDDVLQECKTQNKKLVDFLARPENLEQLVILISQEPDNNVEDKVKFKFPHVACELLTSEVFTIVEQLSTDEHLLGLLWAFLDSPNALNPLVGSFISKVLGMLLIQKASVILQFIRGKEEFLSLFLAHLGTSAMMDFLLQMVAAPDNDQSRIDLALWLKEQGIVDRLVDFLRPTANPEQCVNASLALCEMIRLSREAAQMAAPSPLLGALESEETIRRMLDNMFCADTPSDVVIVNGIAVLLTALEKRPNNVLSPALNRSFAPGEDGTVAVDNTQSIDQILAVVLPRLTDFHNLLTRRPDVPPMVTTIGTLDPPLGNTRLQVVRLFSTLLHCCDVTISKEIMRLKTFDVLMDLFFEFPWNNFLHAQVECCINAALHSPVVLNGNSEGAESVAQNPASLRHYLLTECQLVHRLLKMGEHNDAICSKPGGQRQGYMGHMIRIVNNITQSEEGEERLQDVMKEALDEDTQRLWSDFLSGPVAEMNKKNDTNLGGSRPLASSMDDSDEEFDQLGGGPDSELEKAYQQFQDVKYTNSMMEDYGVDDELNVVQEPFGATFTRLMDINCKITADEEPSQSAAMFETACSERIQQFDDSESDEEESSTWAEKEVSFVSPVDHQSMSSDEDEENSARRPRELQTGSSDEEDRSPTGRAALYHAKIPSIARNEQESDTMEIDETIGVITWRSELSTDEDLTGVVAMDTGAGMTDWTKEPEPTVSSPGSRWADFSMFSARNEQDTTPQDMELETSLEASEITVGGVSGNPNQLDQSPERHDTSQYSLLSPASGGKGEEQASPLVVDNIEVSVTHSESSEEEEDGSSDSDEERSGSYRLNESTGSEKELLLTSSPAQSTSLGQEEVVVGSPAQNRGNQKLAAASGSETVLQEQTGNSTTPSGHELAANGLPPKSVKSNEEQKDSETSQSLRPEPLDGSGVRENANVNCDKVQDGEVEENELQDNFSFLSQQGLLSEDGRRSKPDNHNLVEEKRAEALEACALYEQEVQGQTET